MKYNAVIESSIMQEGQPATAGSKMLEDFVSPIDATVTLRLVSAGIRIVGRADMEEFGLSLTEAVKTYETVDFVADGRADFALCNDYTGAVGYAATERGLYYLHPTYGTVSRYGLIPSVTSMDQIGVLFKEPEVGFNVLKVIAGYDPKDGTMKHSGGCGERCPAETPDLASIRMAGFKPKYFEVYTQIMQILCCAEISNNISRYDGVKYGYRAKEYSGLNELYTKSRTEAFGADIKLAAILGAMVLSQENYLRFYDKAMRLRRMIKDSLEFDKYDVIKTDCPILSRLCGLPSLATPGNVYIAGAGREDFLEVLHGELSGGDAL